MVKGIGFLLFTTGVIFGGRGMFKRWLHRQRMRRNDRYKQRIREAYKRKNRIGYILAQSDIRKWWDEAKPVQKKHQTIICKNPKFASAWEV